MAGWGWDEHEFVAAEELTMMDCLWYYGCLLSGKPSRKKLSQQQKSRKHEEAEASELQEFASGIIIQGEILPCSTVIRSQSTIFEVGIEILSKVPPSAGILVRSSSPSTAAAFSADIKVGIPSRLVSAPADQRISAKAEHTIKSAQKTCVDGIFTIIDGDGDGTVTTSEICRFMDRLGLLMPAEEVESMVRAVSENGLRFLTMEEFQELHCILFGDGEGDAENELLQAFNVFDQNADGVISAHEIVQLLRRLGYASAEDDDHEEQWRCREMIRRIDRNADGVLDFQEFKLFTSSLTVQCCCCCCSAF